MGKSRAEIQKAYRERQKLKDPQFLAKERARQKQNYVPVSQLSKKKREARNNKAKLRNRLSRLRRKTRQENVLEETSGYGSMSSLDDEPYQSIEPRTLIVKLPLPKKHSLGAKKINARALSRAHRTINTLKSEIMQLRKKIKIKNRKIDRINNKTKDHATTSTELTPNKKTESEISSLNLTPQRQKIVRRKLLTGNVLVAEIEKAKIASGKKRVSNIHRIISGQIAKKYRMLTQISRCTSLSRRSLGQIDDKTITLRKEQRKCVSRSLAESVISFLEREDNSRTQPGKADAKKLNDQKGKKQTKVLTDYLKNLHMKYQAENPQQSISLATFRRIRPPNILLASYISRNSCQCIYHQNMALKVQALRKAGVKISENPEQLIQHEHDLDELMKEVPDTVHYRIWKKVALENGKTRMKIIEESVEKTKFLADLKTQTTTFSKHVLRVQEQYKQIRTLKEALPEDEILLQMDFAENFSCRSLDEVQTAYFNQTMVTLHPAVAYYKDNSEMKHKSIVIISDEMSPSASTVCAFIDILIPAMKTLKTNLAFIHYWTDSPSSQYRNRFIFHTIAMHKDLYGIPAKWNYFETGHGKSACDGLGGTTKRMADEAIKQGNATIQDATDFYAWASQSNMKAVEFIYVSHEETRKKHSEMALIKTKPVKGTMMLHAVGIKTENNKTKLMTRDTSCHCETCVGGSYCDSWATQDIKCVTASCDDRKCEVVQNKRKTDKEKNNHNNSGENAQRAEQNSVMDDMGDANEEKNNDKDNTEDSQRYVDRDVMNELQVEDFVAAVYEGKWYLGRIEQKDGEDRECEINFMQKAKNMFKWPQKEDRLWLDS